MVQLGAVLVVFMLIFTGFKFVTARGDESKLTEAKSALFWTIIGGLVLLGAEALSEIICQTAKEFGIKGDCLIR